MRALIRANRVNLCRRYIVYFSEVCGAVIFLLPLERPQRKASPRALIAVRVNWGGGKSRS